MERSRSATEIPTWFMRMVIIAPHVNNQKGSAQPIRSPRRPGYFEAKRAAGANANLANQLIGLDQQVVVIAECSAGNVQLPHDNEHRVPIFVMVWAQSFSPAP